MTAEQCLGTEIPEGPTKGIHIREHRTDCTER